MFFTPINKINNKYNNIYIKREDLIPFSFGGNKVRIAYEFLNDAIKKNADCIIGYGNVRSNLCRVLSNLSISHNIKCVIISPKTDCIKKTNNSILVKMCNAEIVFCEKKDVSLTIRKTIKALKEKGYNPYYINGNEFGEGNEVVPVRAYYNVYNEIKQQEKDLNIEFDYIFHSSGTGMTQSGLICGLIKNNDEFKKVVGISIARNYDQEYNILLKYIKAGLIEHNIDYKLDIKEKIIFCDKYLMGGYGKYNEKLKDFINNFYCQYGIPLDYTYTGKGLYGTFNYLMENDIRGKNILFIHTGGAPLFFDYINEEGLDETFNKKRYI